MPVTVTKADKSKNGKDRVFFDNRHNWQDAYYVSAKCAVPAVGQVIEPETSSKDFNNDGKLTWFLNAYKPAGSVNANTAAVLSAELGKKVEIKDKGWDIPTGDLSRFVSNVLGSAIAANRIEFPSEMAPWIAAAYRALEGLRAGKPLETDELLLPLAPDSTEDQGYDPEDPGFEEDPIPF